jgi:glycyl-tRNA synthetase beta chain
MSELLVELFSEEIPALMQKNAEESYVTIFSKSFLDNKVSHDDIKVFIGPRRIAIHVTGLSKSIPAGEIEIKGPKLGSPERAIEGFCQSNNITKDQLSEILIKDELYYAYIKKIPESDIRKILKTILPMAIAEYIWPKSMYWGNHDIKWVRPLRNILCVFDEQILPITFGHLTANNITYGHRFMAPNAIEIKSYAEYKEKLANNYVMISRQDRQEIIGKQLSLLADSYNLTIKKDERLLEEVAGLVEYPNVMMGKIPEKFLQLPSEVLVTSMRTHQKYFSLFKPAGNFAPYFLFVSNIKSEKPEIIINGNEKVLAARLSDALYFYEQDLSKNLESSLLKLEQIVFHTKIGNLKEKTDRVAKICHYIAPNNKLLQVAAKLYKSDLVSEMVGEFPELQGVMGYYYAKHEGLEEEIAVAIRDHYKPQGPSDRVPTGSAAILALADKIDSLTSLMLVGEQPSGSKDPYALRRLAIGIIRIILDNSLHINLKELVAFSTRLFNCVPQDRIVVFLEERAKFYFKNCYDISLINAVLDLNIEDDLVVSTLKLEALNNLLASNTGKDLLVIYSRASNIIGKSILHGSINKENFCSNYEIELFSVLTEIATRIDKNIKEKDFTASLKLLSSLLMPISNFFDNVMVKDENPDIANNRLLLLQNVKQLFHKIAKFDQL